MVQESVPDIKQPLQCGRTTTHMCISLNKIHMRFCDVHGGQQSGSSTGLFQHMNTEQQGSPDKSVQMYTWATSPHHPTPTACLAQRHFSLMACMAPKDYKCNKNNNHRHQLLCSEGVGGKDCLRRSPYLT